MLSSEGLALLSTEGLALLVAFWMHPSPIAPPALSLSILGACCLPACLYPCHILLRKAAHNAPARHMSFCWCCTGATSWTPALVTLPARQPTFTRSALCWRRSRAPTSLLPWDTSSSSLSLVLPSARRLSRSSLSESFWLVCTV